MAKPPATFQALITALQDFWAGQGCCLLQPFDMEMGAGTFHPATFLRALGPEPWRAAYTQGCRRPTDGRYGENPNRLQHYYQYQVLLKPAPAEIQSLYLDSLAAIGLDLRRHDVRFVEDNWESPTLGAWGLGWEVWLNGMEITQFTYFQQVGGIVCRPVSGEITYGLERLAMHLQGKDSVYKLLWSGGDHADAQGPTVSYGQLFQRNERELSRYNFEEAEPTALAAAFDHAQSACQALVGNALPVAAYEQVLRASHCFNLLDARGTLSVGERQRYMLNVRKLAQAVALSWCGDSVAEQKGGSGKRAKAAAAVPKRSGDAELAVGDSCCLVELGCEELPALELRVLSEVFSEAMSASLREIAVGYKQIEVFATPRRLALLLHGLPKQQPRQEILGPPAESLQGEDGELPLVVRGFARKHACRTEELVLRDTPKGKRWALPAPSSEAPLAESLCGRVEEALRRMSRDHPLRSMRWNVYKSAQSGDGVNVGDTEYSFLRPVRWIALMLDDAPVPGQLFGLPLGRQTYGHRVHAPEPLSLDQASDYALALKQDGHVIANFDDRMEEIRSLIEEVVKQVKGGAEACLEEDDASRRLLEEVAALCEWPIAHVCHFEPRFLAMPEELLRIVLQKQQRYFPLRSRDGGNFLPCFVVISNLQSESPEQIIIGNERVVQARLEDALFFYQNDQKLSLEARRERLRNRVFQEGLGNLYDKTVRLEQLVEKLAQQAGEQGQEPGLVLPAAQLAARLCKSDLETDLVREFPELQGIIGAHYLERSTAASSAGQPERALARKASRAIREHYRNPFSGQVVGSSATSQLLAIADRLDNLLSHVATSGVPSGSSDPFALRPAALGVLSNLLADSDLATTADAPPPYWANMEIKRALIDCADILWDQIIEPPDTDYLPCVDSLMDFFVERLRSFCRQEYQVGSECFNAVLASLPEPAPHPYTSIFPVAFVCRLRYLNRFLADHPTQASALVAAWKRTSNLLRKGAPQGPSNPDISPRAQQLLDVVKQFRDSHPEAPAVSEGGLAAWRWSCSLSERLAALGELARPLADFMDNTLVLCEDPAKRVANLYALQQLKALFSEVADFSKLSL